MQPVPIRTITLGIAHTHPLTPVVIAQAATTLRRARTRYEEAGYEVQTVRLSTRPILDDLADGSPAALFNYVQELQRMLDGVGLAYCSIGTAHAARPNFPLERINVLADLLISTSAISATVQLADTTHGLREDAALPTAQVMKRLARETDESSGNFRFAMLACVAAGCPFFPTAYHHGPASFSLGLQSASIVTQSLASHSNTQGPMALHEITKGVKASLIKIATPIVTLSQRLALEYSLRFGGIDLSPAPMGEDSIATAIERCGYGPLGSTGTLAIASALTTALKTTALPTCGYCGLMLPVLEDALLGKRWEEGYVNPHQLLLYSAVCGTGLDTLPLRGDIAEEEIAALLLDVATLALRLNKPLSARLFPVFGKQAGERTAFTSPYLTNTVAR